MDCESIDDAAALCECDDCQRPTMVILLERRGARYYCYRCIGNHPKQQGRPPAPPLWQHPCYVHGDRREDIPRASRCKLGATRKFK